MTEFQRMQYEAYKSTGPLARAKAYMRACEEGDRVRATAPMKHEEITRQEAAALLSSGGADRKYQPIGLFLLREEDGTWTGIDNSRGDAWVENFPAREICVGWLHEYEPADAISERGEQHC